MIVLNALFPIFILLITGVILKKTGLTDTDFLARSDKLIYYFFFPVMLFWKIGGASFDNGIDVTFYVASLGALVVMFILSTLTIVLSPITNFQAGSFSQSCYRFNTYIGVAVIANSVGVEGIAYFGVLIGFAIPLINVMAVSVLLWFSGNEISLRDRVFITTKALVSNPLILACFAGIIYSNILGVFPVFINNCLSLLSMVALPLALISIGGSLTFTGVRKNFGLSLVAAICKLVVLPLIGFLFYHYFAVDGIAFKVGMIFFTLPASTAIFVLSSQMDSDTDLASSAIVLSTLLSFISLSFVLML